MMNDNQRNNSNGSRDENPARRIDPDLFYECVHCGLCTSACPTYTELGDENDGARGRIQLMQLVADGAHGERLAVVRG